MILHFIVDDKFTDMMYRVFEDVNPGNNTFFLVGNSQKFNYIQKTPVKVIPKRILFSREFLQSLTRYDMVILHWMSDVNLEFISKSPKTVKFVWIGWGGDYYDLITGGDMSRLYQPLTKRLFDNNSKKNLASLKQKVKQVFRILTRKSLNKSLVINRIDFFAPVIYEDYELVKNALPDFKPKFIAWNYGTLEDDLIKGVEHKTLSGNNILIGNSASYEGNHLDAYDIVKRLNTDDRLIISPMSYGNTVYRDSIIRYGRQYWGDRFNPVTDFMPIEDYTNLIRSCSIVIMNSLRQQALGNIIAAMYMGAKIFLNKENPIYNYFKKKGAIIFSIDELRQEIDTHLTHDQVEKNRNILKKHWSREVMYSKTRLLIATVSGK